MTKELMQRHAARKPKTRVRNVVALVAGFALLGASPVAAQNGLVAAYTFDQGSGNSAPDATGTGHTGSISGATWTTSGKFGGALVFDGDNDMVTVADANDLDLTTGMTIEAWVKPSSVSGVQSVIMKERPNIYDYALFANGSSPTAPLAYITVDGRYYGATGRTQLTVGSWAHLAGTYDGTTLRLYVDGALISSTTVRRPMRASGLPLRIGGDNIWGYFFAGTIDEVRVFNRARTGSEIQSDMRTAIGGVSPTPAPAPTPSGPPTRSSGQPTGTLVAGTTQTTLRVTTDQNATCRYAMTAGVAYNSMTSSFTTTGSTAHSTQLTGLTSGPRSYYVRCQGANNGAANTDDYLVSFSVAAPALDTLAPVVTITAPANGATVSGTVTISAGASDNVGVTGVTFRVDGAVIGTDSSAPYSVNWNTSGAAPGSHALSATASDAAGNVGTSASVSVTVGANQAPSVTMTSPADGSSYSTSQTITVSATAADSNGSVVRVDFYQGITLIGSDTSSPFSASWTLSVPGTYALSARAVDNLGSDVTTSASVSVTLTTPVPNRTAVFSPSADDSMVTSYVLDIFTDQADPATDTPVATQDLGRPAMVGNEGVADVELLLDGLRAGAYKATVTAVAATGLARSAASPTFVIDSTTSAVGFALAPAISDATPSPTSAESNGSSPLREPNAPWATSAAVDTRGTLWVTNSSTGLVAAFDATTGDVLATIPVGLMPTGIAAPRGVDKVYVADEESDTVSVISKATMSVVQTIELPAPLGRKPHSVAASPDGRFVYVGELGTNVVDVIDTATDQVSARFSTGRPGSKTQVIVIDPAGDVLYAVTRDETTAVGTLMALEAKTGRPLWDLSTGTDPRGFVIGADGRIGILTRAGDSTAAVIDLDRGAVVDRIDLGAGNEAQTLQLSADGRFLVATLRPTPVRVGVVDLTEIAPMWTVSLGADATSAARSAAELSFVPVSDSRELPPGVVAVDAASHTVVRWFRFPGGGTPHSVAFDPR